MTSELTYTEGCYCLQGQKCPHWIVSNRQAHLELTPQYSDQSRHDESEGSTQDHRSLIIELQRELRIAMLEIEKVNKTSRDLAKINHELEEARFVAVSDQARTAKRLLLMTSQLEHTEQALFNLTQEIGDGQKDSELLRIERIKREALQEREDASRLKIEGLQDELHEVQRSERTAQQKLLIMQTKYEALGKRYDLLRRQTQELDLVRESREALAWLKETTERLCSPPQGSLGQAIQQEKSLQGSAGSVAPINIYQTSPSSSPPYPTAISEPPLIAQNQLVSLIKELATTNSTLRNELAEYRDLLQDARNEVITLRSQVEDYEHGHAYECCNCGYFEDPAETVLTAKTTNDANPQHVKEHAEAHSGSPPPYVTTHPTEQHLHHHFHLPGVRGNIFGELERRYHQDQQPLSSSKRRDRHSSKRESGGRRSSRDHHNGALHSKSAHPRSHSHHRHSHSNQHANPTDVRTTTVSTSTSTSEARRALIPSGTNSSTQTSAETKQRAHDGTSAKKSRGIGKRSLYTDVDMDLLGSGSERDDDDQRNRNEFRDPAESLSDIGESESDHEPGFVATFAEVMY
ncbi:hypothetical protein BX616_000529 [Lobosporangium transversale]|nr:hypothetical protein BX616_000529 [Lobosporangium transversale]